MKRKLAIPLISIAVLACALTAFMTYKPSSKGPQLPDWFMQVKPSQTAHASLVDPSTFTIATTATIDTETRRFPTDFKEFTKRLEVDLTKQPGWKKANPGKGTVTWIFNTPSGQRSLLVTADGTGVKVDSNWNHTLTWLEKSQNKVRRMFGGKE